MYFFDLEKREFEENTKVQTDCAEINDIVSYTKESETSKEVVVFVSDSTSNNIEKISLHKSKQQIEIDAFWYN